MASTSRVIGYLSASDVSHNASWDYRPDTRVTYVDDVVRPQVGLISVAKEWRRTGVATALVRALASDAGMTTDDITWEQPFTEAGKALARTVSPERVWVS
jgi:GNAT superfamily N-acetyltransferase